MKKMKQIIHIGPNDHFCLISLFSKNGHKVEGVAKVSQPSVVGFRDVGE